jgi:hypothetical protein
VSDAGWLAQLGAHDLVRIAARRGPKKAPVAVLYDDPGADYYTRCDPERLKRHALSQLQRLGYNVRLSPIAASA